MGLFPRTRDCEARHHSARLAVYSKEDERERFDLFSISL